MKPTFKTTLLTFLFSCTLLTACKKEDTLLVEAPTQDLLLVDAKVTDLVQKVSINDGSFDNIIDRSNCFNIKFPLHVTVNSQEIHVNSEEDYKAIEFLLDDEDHDIDVLEITYPVTIILEDFTEVEIYNGFELNNHSSNCHGENESDDDIECLDFQYPITASTFNKISEAIETITLTSDHELNDFMKTLHHDLVTTMNFPVNVALTDGTMLEILNTTELELTINEHKDDCDEDDDFDHNDDDCNDCNIEALTQTLTRCGGWEIDKLVYDSVDLDNLYNIYEFNFSEDGTIAVETPTHTARGTWSASGTKKNITVTIDIPELPFCNHDWVLQEMSEYSNTRLDLRVDDTHRLRYNNSCD